MEIQKEFTKYYVIETTEDEIERHTARVAKLIQYCEYILDDVYRIKENNFLCDEDRDLFIEFSHEVTIDTLPNILKEAKDANNELTEISNFANEIGTSNNEVINRDIE